MTGKGLPKGDHKDYRYIFMRVYPLDWEKTPNNGLYGFMVCNITLTFKQIIRGPKSVD